MPLRSSSSPSSKDIAEQVVQQLLPEIDQRFAAFEERVNERVDMRFAAFEEKIDQKLEKLRQNIARDVTQIMTAHFTQSVA